MSIYLLCIKGQQKAERGQEYILAYSYELCLFQSYFSASQN